MKLEYEIETKSRKRFAWYQAYLLQKRQGR